MDSSKAMSLVRIHSLASEHPGLRPQIDFVTPAVATIVAARSIVDDNFRESVDLAPECQSYAATIGLDEVLKGTFNPAGQIGRRHGRSYSRLTRLSLHAEVDGCNEVISDVLHEQLVAGDSASQLFVQSVVKVVGELHDNVASHAHGVGYSAVQVYEPDGERRILFAVADSGCGMLKNASRVSASISSDEDAIKWCLVKGNTSAHQRDGWEQRLPDDCQFSPLPTGVRAFSDENHHAGQGLYELSQLVKLANGGLWIWSGNSSFIRSKNGAERFKTAEDLRWQGVAIEFELSVDTLRTAIGNRVGSAKLESLAKRLGL